MLAKIVKTAAGYQNHQDGLPATFPDLVFWAELTPVPSRSHEPARLGDDLTPAARLHAILDGQQPHPVGKKDYLEYLADKHS